MYDLDYSNRPPLTPAQLSHALAEAAKMAQVKRKATPGMSTHKQQQAELFKVVIANWYTFLVSKFNPSDVGAQRVEVKSKTVIRYALMDLAQLRSHDQSLRRPYIQAASTLKKAELQWLRYLDGITKEWRENVSEEAGLALARLNKDFLQFVGGDAIKVLRHGYGSATNTYWGLVAVGEKLRVMQGAGPASEQSRRDLSESARRLSLVLSSLHMEHLREVDLTLRGQSPLADYRPHYFKLDGDRLLVKQSAALLKLPETGTSIATGCPAATAHTEDHGNVASSLLRLFEMTYLKMPTGD